MSLWTTFIILVGVVGSLLTIYEFISSRIGSSPRRSRQLALLFGAVTLAFLVVSVIFANVLSPLLGTRPGIAPTQSITPQLSGKGVTPTPTQAMPTATSIPSPTQILPPQQYLHRNTQQHNLALALNAILMEASGLKKD